MVTILNAGFLIFLSSRSTDWTTFYAGPSSVAILFACEKICSGDCAYAQVRQNLRCSHMRYIPKFLCCPIYLYFSHFSENVQMAWVGANDIVEEGTYRWTNGELVQNTLWSSRNPSDSTTYNCIAISRYGLEDEHCGSKVNYQHICQIVIH